MSHNDMTGAQAFFDHAHKIYEEKLKQIMDGESKELRIDELWLDIYKGKLPESEVEQKKISEKLLTLSSMIFLRSTKNMPVMPQESVIAEKAAAPVIAS
jgi:hypothetical protein